MAELDKGETVTLEEVMVLTLAKTDALTKLLIEKGLITDEEFQEEVGGGESDVPGDIKAASLAASTLVSLAKLLRPSLLRVAKLHHFEPLRAVRPI